MIAKHRQRSVLSSRKMYNGLEYLRALQKLMTSIDSESESNNNNNDGNNDEDKESITTRQKKNEGKFTYLLCIRVSHLSTPAIIHESS
jgi:hypothetical protein